MNAKRVVLTLVVGLVAAVLSDAAYGFETAVAAPGEATTRPQPPRAGTCARNRTVVEQRNCDALRQLNANARETEKRRRWALKKQLCRELDIRFDRSGLCW